MKIIEKPRNKNHRSSIKIEFNIFDYSSCKNFFKNFHLVTDRSRCTDFYLINEGPQNIRIPLSIYEVKKCSVIKDVWETPY